MANLKGVLLHIWLRKLSNLEGKRGRFSHFVSIYEESASKKMVKIIL